MRTAQFLCKSYELLNGNPIQDTIEMFENLGSPMEAQTAKLEVLGVATTGYACQGYSEGSLSCGILH